MSHNEDEKGIVFEVKFPIYLNLVFPFRVSTTASKTKRRQSGAWNPGLSKGNSTTNVERPSFNLDQKECMWMGQWEANKAPRKAQEDETSPDSRRNAPVSFLLFIRQNHMQQHRPIQAICLSTHQLPADSYTLFGSTKACFSLLTLHSSLFTLYSSF